MNWDDVAFNYEQTRKAAQEKAKDYFYNQEEIHNRLPQEWHTGKTVFSIFADGFCFCSDEFYEENPTFKEENAPETAE